jgi:L-alanine-DL-glutamate epimerase-like enolase superfamily enzyme
LQQNLNNAIKSTLTSDVVDTSGFVFKDGAFSVPDTPGLGLELNQQVYDEKYTGREDWQVE